MSYSLFYYDIQQSLVTIDSSVSKSLVSGAPGASEKATALSQLSFFFQNCRVLALRCAFLWALFRRATLARFFRFALVLCLSRASSSFRRESTNGGEFEGEQ